MTEISSLKTPILTVGIPFYNATDPNQLRLAIDSIINQTLPADEIHLIQDGNVGDKLEALVTEYQKKHTIVKIIKINQNQGLPYALNLSILKTSTRYYARMDADDISHPERFKKQIEFLENNPEISILGTWVEEFSDANQNSKVLRKMPTDLSKIKDLLHYRNPIIHPSVMFRHNVFAKIGLYDTSFLTAQDLELWSRALKTNVGITNLPEVLLYYRVSEIISKHSSWKRVIRQAKARYGYHTISPRLNFLKVAILLFHLLPYSIREWGHKNLR